MHRISRYTTALAFVMGVAFAAPACAQTYGPGGYGRYPDRGGYTRDFERRAYDRGYREGLDEGRDDARRGRNYAPARHDEYRDADDGFRRGDGDREFYRRMYRRGFEVGYRESFDRYARADRRRW
jgi:hypothetical protein